MRKNDSQERELEELLRQVDSLLDGSGESVFDDDPEQPAFDDDMDEPMFDDDVDAPMFDDDAPLYPDFDPDEYTPRDAREDEAMLYRNYSNQYGAQIRNYQNGYGSGQTPDETPRGISVSAYNADFRTPKRRDPEPEYRDEPEYDEPRRPRGRGCCGTVLLALGAVVLAAVLAVCLLFRPPNSGEPGRRKADTATILVCGTDADGTRTDTMMLLYLSGSEGKIGLLSLPRDTYTIATAGYAAKLNSAYGRNNCGAEGMEALLDYVADIIGYRPDGYILVDMELVPKVVDRMGGVEINVPLSFTEGKVALSKGMQRLNGTQVLALLRHRSSYAMADLTRVEVQRSVLKACMEQWVSAGRLTDVPGVLKLVQGSSLSDLNTRNYLWMGKTILLNLGKGFVTETLPGRADYIAGGSYYILDRQGVADLINDSFNPYKADISAGDLNIAG